MSVKPAAFAFSITAVSSLNLRTDLPSTSLKPDHSLPWLIAESVAYAKTSSAHFVSLGISVSTSSISLSVKTDGSLNSNSASLRFSSARLRHVAFALQNLHQSPASNSPSPAPASSALGLSTLSAQEISSATGSVKVDTLSRLG